MVLVIVRNASPAAAAIVRVRYCFVLLPAVLCTLVVGIEVHVALAPRDVALLMVILVVARLMRPALVREPLFVMTVELSFSLKLAHVMGLPSILMEV